MINKEKFKEFMESEEITFQKMYYIDDDSYIDTMSCQSISDLVFDKPKEFKEVSVFWNPKYERYEMDIDNLLSCYEDEWFDFCEKNNLNNDSVIEYYEKQEQINGR